MRAFKKKEQSNLKLEHVHANAQAHEHTHYPMNEYDSNNFGNQKPRWHKQTKARGEIHKDSAQVGTEFSVCTITMPTWLLPVQTMNIPTHGAIHDEQG
jgi:hypothetical protein